MYFFKFSQNDDHQANIPKEFNNVDKQHTHSSQDTNQVPYQIAFKDFNKFTWT